MSEQQRASPLSGNGGLPLNDKDPYAILNVPRDASSETIQQSYKLLSRSFHPDKQPPGPSRDAAQQVFVAFKNAHEILMDPVLRQAYDEHGSSGVLLVKRTANASSADSDALYPKLSRLHQLGYAREATSQLRKELQALEFERSDREVHVSGTLEFPCTTETTALSGHGHERVSIPELTEARMAFAVTSASGTDNNKWTVTVGGSSNLDSVGHADTSGQLALAYKPVQGTDVTAELDVSNPYKFSLGTTRSFSSRTLSTITVRTIPNTRNLSLGIATHRPLFQNTIRGMWALGVGTDRNFHYGLLSFTTLSLKYPQCTLKLNLNVDSCPVKVSSRHVFENGRVGHLSFGWGPLGIEVKTLLSRLLTTYATFGIGIRHASQTGLTWLFQIERGDIAFRIPITVSSVGRHDYGFRFLWMLIMTYLIDDVLSDAVQDTIVERLEREHKLRRDSSLLQTTISKRDAVQQVQLMRASAESCRELEKRRGGLVIRKATYFVEGGDSMDATTQLQFMVVGSRLRLPPTPKCSLLGFYTIQSSTAASNDLYEGLSLTAWFLNKARRLTSSGPGQLQSEQIAPTPRMSVRYEYEGYVFDISVSDDEELILPDDLQAVCLGEATVVLQ